MAWVKTVAAPSVAGTSTTLVMTLAADINVPVGNTLIAAVFQATSGTSQSVSSIADSKSNTWEIVSNVAGSTLGTTIAKAWITNALAPGDTITVTFTGATAVRMALVNEFADVDNVAVDKFAQTSATNGTPNSGTTATTTTANELLIGVLHVHWGSTVPTTDNFVPTAETPAWTGIGSVVSSAISGIYKTAYMHYRYVSATGGYNFSGTMTSRAHRVSISTYPAAGAAVDVGRSQAIIIG